MLKLYANIKARRLELGMTQTELAEMMGYADKSIISKIESGKVDITQSKIMKFSGVLQTSPGRLMGDVCQPEVMTISDSEAAVLSSYRLLDSTDQARIMERIETMLEADKYKGKDTSGAKAG